jgi:hypothetical protein
MSVHFEIVVRHRHNMGITLNTSGYYNIRESEAIARAEELEQLLGNNWIVTVHRHDNTVVRSGLMRRVVCS